MKAAKELKGFKKVMVSAGKEVEVKLELKASDLAYFDENQMKWVVSPGKYKILVGSSSQDIKATTIITIN